jgi:glycosyltransferase involved in cell wall biosynthesis
VACQLLVVIPVYNEAKCLASVLREWSAELDSTQIDYEVLILDDGSKDKSAEIIADWVRENAAGRVTSLRHPNIGHGQTCLEGYRRACWSGVPWVLQIDSDGQCDPSFFPAVWDQRLGHDVVYGQRTRRRDGWKRVMASGLVRAVVKMTTGCNCVDANVPYRLMSTAKLLPLVDSIPTNFDLANIALAVQIRRAGWRETSVPIVFRARTGGEPSVPLARFAGKALELFAQLLLLPRPVLRGAK